MERKNEIVLFVLVLLAALPCIFAAGSSSVPTSTNNIGTFYINDQSLYSPYPAEPGHYVDLWLRVQYIGEKTTVENVTCKIDPAFPFSIDLGDSAEKAIGIMAPYDEALLKYRLRVNESAVQGDNTLVFECRSNSADWISTELTIYVQTHEAVVNIDKVESLPLKFQPGETGTVNIYLTNLGDNTIKDISLNLDLSSADTMFAPVNSTTEKRIEELTAKNSTIVPFDVIALQDATPNTYKIPLTLSYSDDLGNKYSKDTIIALIIQSKQPDIFVTPEQTAYIRNGTKNTVTVSIVNRGTTQVKFLTAELHDGEGYKILTPSQLYIGSINSDDSQTAGYDLFIDTNSSNIQLPLTLDFEDIDGNSYALNETVDVMVYSTNTAIAYGIDKAISVDPLVTGLILIIGLYLLYRVIKFIFFRKKV